MGRLSKPLRQPPTPPSLPRPQAPPHLLHPFPTLNSPAGTTHWATPPSPPPPSSLPLGPLSLSASPPHHPPSPGLKPPAPAPPLPYPQLSSRHHSLGHTTTK